MFVFFLGELSDLEKSSGRASECLLKQNLQGKNFLTHCCFLLKGAFAFFFISYTQKATKRILNHQNSCFDLFVSFWATPQAVGGVCFLIQSRASSLFIPLSSFIIRVFETITESSVPVCLFVASAKRSRKFFRPISVVTLTHLFGEKRTVCEISRG